MAIAPLIFVEIYILTTFMKSHNHSAYNGANLAKLWALYQKIIAPKARIPLNQAIK